MVSKDAAVSTAQVINMLPRGLPSNLGRLWTWRNPGWELHGSCRGRENRPCTPTPQAPASSWGQEKRWQPGLAHLCFSGKEGNSTRPQQGAAAHSLPFLS